MGGAIETNVQQLRCFTRVAEMKNCSMVATSPVIAQPALGTAIRKLGEEPGSRPAIARQPP